MLPECWKVASCVHCIIKLHLASATGCGSGAAKTCCIAQVLWLTINALLSIEVAYRGRTVATWLCGTRKWDQNFHWLWGQVCASLMSQMTDRHVGEKAGMHCMWPRKQVCIDWALLSIGQTCWCIFKCFTAHLPTWRVMSLCLPFSWVAAKRSLGFSLSGFEVKFWLLTPLMAWVRAAAGKKTFSRQQVKKRLNCKKTFSKIKSIRCLCY